MADSSSLPSSEDRYSFDSWRPEYLAADEDFYESFDAPKFVDFTVPDHYRPDDDRFWFCLRAGCDQQHEEEMELEAIHRKFVLRAMAARNRSLTKLRRTIDANALRTPTKSPLSALSNSSKQKVSRMAIISPISEKMVEDKTRVVRPPLKPPSPKTSTSYTNLVAAKYLTIPRNKNCSLNHNSFRSIQNTAKALVFNSPKKNVKIKTSVGNLCEERQSFQTRHLSNKTPTRQVQRRVEEAGYSQTSTNPESKSEGHNRTNSKGRLYQQKMTKELPEDVYIGRSKDNGSNGIKQRLLEGVGRSKDNGSNGIKQRLLEGVGECKPMPELKKNTKSETSGEMMAHLKEKISSEERKGFQNNNINQNGRERLDLHEGIQQVENEEVARPCAMGLTMVKFKTKLTSPKPFRLRTDERGTLKESNMERQTNLNPTSSQGEGANLHTPTQKWQGKLGQDVQNTTERLKTPNGERSKPEASATPDRLCKPIKLPLKRDAIQIFDKFKTMTSHLHKHRTGLDRLLQEIRK